MHNHFKTLHGTAPIAFILRHAERDPFDKIINAMDALLTPKGKEDACAFGKQISIFSPMHLYHSPVERCKQTANHVIEGIISQKGEAEYRGPIPALGVPYLLGEWKEMILLMEDLGFEKFLRHWFNGELPAHMVMPLKEAARTQLEILVKQLKDNNISTINVTHDWNIMLLREYFFGLRHEEIGSPGFLDGLAAAISGNEILLWYHDQHISIPLADFS